ncbi:MAG: DivIVA domain-containing protein [Actinomycetota bacterium]
MSTPEVPLEVTRVNEASMSPLDIQHKQFKVVFRGYDQEEVDTFLDEVSDAFERLYVEVRSLRDRNAQLEARTGEEQEVSDMLKRTLLVAQKTADVTLSEAREKSDTLLAQARGRAEAVEAQLKVQGEALQANAARARAEIEEWLGSLQRFGADHASRMRAFLQQELRALETMAAPQIGEAPTPPAGLSSAQPTPGAWAPPPTQ